MNLETLYAAAHAEFPDTAPLGGGKGVADYLIREWRAQKPFPLTVLSPHSLGLAGEPRSVVAESGQPRQRVSLHEMSEREYARFCRAFEQATTTAILAHNPHACVVLCNDISEGPQFRTLGERGYQLVTIFHVDVVEYFSKFYLRELVSPALLARWRAFSMMPGLLRLVFQKQFECVRHSARIIVPSSPMRDTILKCYPDCPPGKIIVLPWGDVSGHQAAPIPPAGITAEEFVILTLSRLSPEKGIERLLAALPHLRPASPKATVVICGAAAYMKGQAYERKLRRLAARVTNARIEFAGHVVGAQKAGWLQRADVFVSPSRHESYGLTIAEAQAAGCRIISHRHYGATGTIVDCGQPRELASALDAMIAAGRTCKTAGIIPRNAAAERLAKILIEVAQDHPGTGEPR